MEIDPIDLADQASDTSTSPASPASPASARHNARLNTWVALTVALLATFMGICKVKDDNIVQGMQQAQADRIDNWSFYQARNIRQEVAQAELTQLNVARATATVPASRAVIDSAVVKYSALVADQAAKKDSVRALAVSNQATYDALNRRDDQFDLSDTLLALAISLLALTSLTHKRWLYGVAMVPTMLGVLMGLAGLCGWPLHPDAIMRMLS